MPAPTAEVLAIVLPLDKFRLSSSEFNISRNATELLVRDCMRERGFAWEIRMRPEHSANLKNRRRYGVIERQVAAELGYYAPREILGPTEVLNWELDRDAKLRGAEKRAALDPKSGCYRKADDQLWRAGRPDTALMNDVSAESFEVFQKDPQVVTSMKSWRDCMRTAGFKYSDVWAANDDPRWTGRSRPSEEEIATARADVECKGMTHLVKVSFSAESAIQERLIQRRPHDFEKMLAAKRTYIRNVQSVLSRDR